MTAKTEIKRLANGSIDVEHYVEIGRSLHGQAVCAAAGRIISAPYRLIARLGRLISRWRRSIGAPSDLSPAGKAASHQALQLTPPLARPS